MRPGDVDGDSYSLGGSCAALGNRVFLAGGPASMDSFLAGDITLMDRDQDLSLLPVPLLPLPNDSGLLPDTGLGQRSVSADGPSQLEPCTPAVSTSRDLSREGPFNAYGATSGDFPLISDGLPGCPYRMTLYKSVEVADVDPAYGLQLHHPLFLEYVGAPESARLLTRAPGHWVQTMDREEAVTAALQLQHDAGLITSNLPVLGQFVTSLNRMSSEVMRLAFGKEVFPSDAVEAISPAPRIHRAPHYMAAIGLWRLMGGPGTPGPLSISLCRNCMQCTDCFPELTK